jgi:hypothetical protein
MIKTVVKFRVAKAAKEAVLSKKRGGLLIQRD